ncbi:MAG: hypothetical protein CFE30_17960 [Bradyrhizobium sp. PARBB1]|nr:MAG: limonene 1,2-monooxygenase [Bradyrhizobium sp. DFCI-1]OYU60987.1 MAG: hypothetical protein CFE30_17960 [Bradyrhizobium sp. PARBB1]PSO22687.1 hypothetical protein C7G43_26320 [Bradyrhizobium sp. MOS004]HAQ80074.1 hypothetical protein [Bradyrhizobium sp.]HAR17724.1 hypothetical protein [Bradyrhizobium sp.]
MPAHDAPERPEARASETWEGVATAPFDRDLELAVIEGNAIHKLVFPCRRTLGGWVKSGTVERIVVQPTHWRSWAK